MNDDDGKSSIRMIEFFSGIGGMRISIEKALNWRNNNNHKSKVDYQLERCFAYDISLHANRVYSHNFGGQDDTVCTKLVEQLKVEQIRKMNANLWTMSPPCQPFTSNASNKKQLDNDDKRCNGLKGIMRLLVELTFEEKPKWIFLENVKGFATSQMCSLFCECLDNNGYSYKSYLLSPISLGIPNHRKRFYILGTKKKISNDSNNNTAAIERNTTIHDHTSFVNSVAANNSSFVADGCSIRTIKPKTISRYLDPTLLQSSNNNFSDESILRQYRVPKSILEKSWSKNLGIVTSRDTQTHCFTAGYGRIYHKSTGSLLLTPNHGCDDNGNGNNNNDNNNNNNENTDDDSGNYSEAVAIDRTDMLKYENRLRRFTPNELLKLFGFINIDDGDGDADDDGNDTNDDRNLDQFEIPTTIVPSLEQRYKLIGNSINVNVVTQLLFELLQSS